MEGMDGREAGWTGCVSHVPPKYRSMPGICALKHLGLGGAQATVGSALCGGTVEPRPNPGFAIPGRASSRPCLA